MLTPYQQRISNFYTARIDYDNDFTRDRALHHLDYAEPELGQNILDVGTGTGFVAIAAAEIVGANGSVVGIDITQRYLEKAQEKITAAGLTNVQLIEIDEAKFNPEPEQFDRIYCSSSMVLFPDIPASLQRWFNWLKPGGFAVFTCHPETAFFTPFILKACLSQGISLPNLHEPLGTIDRCYDLMQTAGFEDIEVHTVDQSEWISVQNAKQIWDGRTWFHQNDPLPDLPEEKIAEIKASFDRLLKAKNTKKGIWNDYQTFYVVGRKPG